MRGVLCTCAGLVALAAPASAQTHRIECVGVVKFLPVHDFHDPELRKGRAILDDGRAYRANASNQDQDDDCSNNLTGKHLTTILKTCHQDDQCKVVGIAGPNGWVRIDHVEKK
jgi:hypothetical protein